MPASPSYASYKGSFNWTSKMLDSGTPWQGPIFLYSNTIPPLHLQFIFAMNRGPWPFVKNLFLVSTFLFKWPIISCKSAHLTWPIYNRGHQLIKTNHLSNLMKIRVKMWSLQCTHYLSRQVF
jgi:hypothetical protein